MSKYYFSKDDEEVPCYTLQYWKDVMKEDSLTELEILEAVMDRHIYYFYCSVFGEIGQVGEGCGRECEKYAPRNGKSGRCKHSKNCYTSTGKSRILHLNTITGKIT